MTIWLHADIKITENEPNKFVLKDNEESTIKQIKDEVREYIKTLQTEKKSLKSLTFKVSGYETSKVISMNMSGIFALKIKPELKEGVK
jgi:sugar-specific transcriptional regulator TrmB